MWRLSIYLRRYLLITPSAINLWIWHSIAMMMTINSHCKAMGWQWTDITSPPPWSLSSSLYCYTALFYTTIIFKTISTISKSHLLGEKHCAFMQLLENDCHIFKKKTKKPNNKQTQILSFLTTVWFLCHYCISHWLMLVSSCGCWWCDF